MKYKLSKTITLLLIIIFATPTITFAKPTVLENNSCIRNLIKKEQEREIRVQLDEGDPDRHWPDLTEEQIVELENLSFKAENWITTHFGGPTDTGVGANETGSVTGEKLREIDTEERYYSAYPIDRNLIKSGMKESQVPGYFNKILTCYKLRVTNPENQKFVDTEIIDRGPIGLGVADLSNRTQKDIGVWPSGRVNLLLIKNSEATKGLQCPEKDSAPIKIEPEKTPRPPAEQYRLRYFKNWFYNFRLLDVQKDYRKGSFNNHKENQNLISVVKKFGGASTILNPFIESFSSLFNK